MKRAYCINLRTNDCTVNPRDALAEFHANGGTIGQIARVPGALRSYIVATADPSGYEGGLYLIRIKDTSDM